jgi:uncharacterized membrane protein (DUF106 family)
MSWEIFLGIAALLSFLVMIINPMTKLTKTMTELNINMKNLNEAFELLTKKNNETHDKILQKLEEHESRLNAIEVTMDITERLHPELTGLRQKSE